MRISRAGLSICFLVRLTPEWMEAQLADPGEGGVALGHVHLTVSDRDFYQKVFTLARGVPVKNGELDMLQFPGIMILARKGEPNGEPNGSSVN